jgi:hypothetical protein
MRPTSVLIRAADTARALFAHVRRLIDAVPPSFVAALAAFALAAILYTVATRTSKEIRGYAEVTLFPDGCTVDFTRQLRARDCQVVTRGVYRVTFTRSLASSTAIASRGSCCLGRIAASVETPRTVLLVVPRRIRRPVRASVIVP